MQFINKTSALNFQKCKNLMVSMIFYQFIYLKMRNTSGISCFIKAFLVPNTNTRVNTR